MSLYFFVISPHHLGWIKNINAKFCSGTTIPDRLYKYVAYTDLKLSKTDTINLHISTAEAELGKILNVSRYQITQDIILFFNSDLAVFEYSNYQDMERSTNNIGEIISKLYNYNPAGTIFL